MNSEQILNEAKDESIKSKNHDTSDDDYSKEIQKLQDLLEKELSEVENVNIEDIQDPELQEQIKEIEQLKKQINDNNFNDKDNNKFNETLQIFDNFKQDLENNLKRYDQFVNDKVNLIKENLNELKYVKYEEGKFYAFNSLEKKEIEPNDYILRGLDIDIENNYYFPLKILLLRNESFQKFSKNGGKGFLEDLGLYDDFIDYLKKFIKSNSFKELIKSVDEYKNIGILLDNEEYINEMLDETHFEFLPFYGASNIFGYTNKDIMISFVNSIPEITKNIRIYYKNEIENITNICLLFTIAVKFISSLHEFIIHLTYSYLNYVTEKELEAKSKKESLDSSDDGGFFFEKKLKGHTKFEFLNINNVVNLLDGISFNKTLEKFQNDLKCKFNYDDLINKMENKNYNGFLKKFLGKYKIDFSYFKKFKNKNPKISCRVKNGVGISMFRDGNDSYGGSEATKKSKEFEILSMNSDKQ
jgi:hypothetical protein